MKVWWWSQLGGEGSMWARGTGTGTRNLSSPELPDISRPPFPRLDMVSITWRQIWLTASKTTFHGKRNVATPSQYFCFSIQFFSTQLSPLKRMTRSSNSGWHQTTFFTWVSRVLIFVLVFTQRNSEKRNNFEVTILWQHNRGHSGSSKTCAVEKIPRNT